MGFSWDFSMRAGVVKHYFRVLCVALQQQQQQLTSSRQSVGDAADGKSNSVHSYKSSQARTQTPSVSAANHGLCSACRWFLEKLGGQKLQIFDRGSRLRMLKISIFLPSLWHNKIMSYVVVCL